MIFFTAATLSAMSLTFSLLLKRRTSISKNMIP
jgi:hypothetical protein